MTYGKFEYWRPDAIAAPLPLFFSCLINLIRLSGIELIISTENSSENEKGIISIKFKTQSGVIEIK
jgi:hypothetical protein